MAGFEPDFYNNVVTVAVVLLFTKLVTHRSGKKRATYGGPWLWWVLHAVSTASAAAAVVVGLVAVHYRDDSFGQRYAAWTLLGVSFAILVIDVLVEDLPLGQGGGGTNG
ncbi:hypothetical protein [Streptomyces sp. NPDC046909]|uniref:hypothetical protein n=1 Tax=Streptomyces sp. NPDC046909 TaxID=3155617 RepID=UPI0033FC022B